MFMYVNYRRTSVFSIYVFSYANNVNFGELWDFVFIWISINYSGSNLAFIFQEVSLESWFENIFVQHALYCCFSQL